MHEAEAQVEAVARQVHSDVRLAVQSVSYDEAALVAARTSAEQAHRELDLVTQAYQAGANTSLDVTTTMKITWQRVFSLLTLDGRAATGPSSIRYATAPLKMQCDKRAWIYSQLSGTSLRTKLLRGRSPLGEQ